LLNLPNSLALFRILLAPLMVYVLITPELLTDRGFHESWVSYTAGLLFVIASVTDFFDGYIAREWDQKTELGAILDPLADKMLVIGAFLGLLLIGEASIWAIYIILIRELFISGLRIIGISKGIDVSASWSGKIKTVVQMFAIGFLVMGWSYGTELLWFSVFLTVYSAVEYILAYGKAIKSKK